jgi:hypothetical protein
MEKIMGYCNEQDIVKTIAQALTSATAQTSNDLGTLSSLLNVGNVLDSNLVTSDNVNYYIQQADSEIDSVLNLLYVTPFCEKCDFETVLFSAVEPSNPYIVLETHCPLASGDIVLLSSVDEEERHVIDKVIGGDTFSTISEIQYSFPVGTRLLRVSYPPPLRFISARLASANIYDKYFSSESSPNTSNYGEKLRELGKKDLFDVLNGSVIMHGQHRTGRRFYNPNLVDQYTLPHGSIVSSDYKPMK